MVSCRVSQTIPIPHRTLSTILFVEAFEAVIWVWRTRCWHEGALIGKIMINQWFPGTLFWNHSCGERPKLPGRILNWMFSVFFWWHTFNEPFVILGFGSKAGTATKGRSSSRHVHQTQSCLLGGRLDQNILPQLCCASVWGPFSLRIVDISIYGGFLKTGVPSSWIVYKGKSHENGWFGGTPWYPHFRKHQYVPEEMVYDGLIFGFDSLIQTQLAAQPSHLSDLGPSAAEVPTSSQSALAQRPRTSAAWSSYEFEMIWLWVKTPVGQQL